MDKRQNTFRTRTSHTQPLAVVCVIAFPYMTKAIARLPHESPSISIPVAWFVQCRPCTAYMMRNWLQEAWEPPPGGLADSPQFLDFSQRAASLESSWFRLSIFGALGLNNRARCDRIVSKLGFLAGLGFLFKAWFPCRWMRRCKHGGVNFERAKNRSLDSESWIPWNSWMLRMRR